MPVNQQLCRRSPSDVDQRLALGSFFFSRGDPTRNTAEALIPTLVYQLAQLLPLSLQVLNPIIDSDPLILKKSLPVQLRCLLVPTLQHLVRLGIIKDAPNSPRVFLVDGLDECNDHSQRRIIVQAAATMCHEHGIPVKFLIASRSEHEISTSFKRYHCQANHSLGVIYLSDNPDAEADIRQFIEDSLQGIQSQHPFNQMIPSEWPDPRDVDRLVRKSSSHFIYASVALKYIWSAKENPVRSLRVVLCLEEPRTLSPFSELDALYRHILESAAHCDKVLQIIAHCEFATCLPSVTSFVCLMLDCSFDDLIIYLADVTPLVAIRRSTHRFRGDLDVKLLHASLGDFVDNQSRSGSLHINRVVYLASKLERCFQLLDLCDHGQGYQLNSQSHYLKEQIKLTINDSAHLVETRQLLRQSRRSLCHFYQFDLRTWLRGFPLPFFWCSLFAIIKELHSESAVSMRVHIDFWVLLTYNNVLAQDTPDDTLFRDIVEDFFDTFELCANSESPLGPAILPLMLLGYPATKICEIICYRSTNRITNYNLTVSYSNDGVTKPRALTFLDFISTAIPIRYGAADASIQRLAAEAAEAILEHLFDSARLPSTSAYSGHRSWLQRTKPGKHLTVGAPRLASALHTRSLSSLHLLEDVDLNAKTLNRYEAVNLRAKCSMLRFISIGLGLKHHLLPNKLYQRQDELLVAVRLIRALLWVLPKANFSEKILLYSSRTFPRSIYQRKSNLCHRVYKSLDHYIARVQNAKLKELCQSIENGEYSV